MSKKNMLLFLVFLIILIILLTIFFTAPLNTKDITGQALKTSGWTADWNYRRAITIDNTNNANELINYQVKVELTPDNFDYSGASSTGADIRFTDTNGATIIDYWIEEWNNNGISIIWVEVPNIPASSRKIIYMYYGNPAAVSASNGDNTFEFFDDFSSAKTINVDYFASIGSRAATYMMNVRQASYYNGKTYVVFQGNNFDPYIMSYNHSSKKWFGPVRVGDNPLNNDAHGAPDLLIDKYGYLHVFYGSHKSAQKYAKSTYPEDISSWSAMSNVASIATYPQAMQMSDGKIYIFYRGEDAWVYRTSTNNGSSWSTETKILSGYLSWYVTFVKGEDDTVHVTFIWRPSSDPSPWMGDRYHIYYMFRDTDGKWKNINGEVLTLPITKTKADEKLLVFNSGNNITQIPWVDTDSSDKPYIIFITGPPYQSANNTYKFAKWNGVNWDIHNIGASTDSIMDFYTIDVISPSVIDAYIVTGGTAGIGDDVGADRGGNIEKWSTSDGGITWTKITEIITKSLTGEVYNHPQTVFNGHPDAKLIFSEWTDSFNDFTNKVFLWAESGFIQNQNPVWTENGNIVTTLSNGILVLRGPASGEDAFGGYANILTKNKYFSIDEALRFKTKIGSVDYVKYFGGQTVTGTRQSVSKKTIVTQFSNWPAPKLGVTSGDNGVERENIVFDADYSRDYNVYEIYRYLTGVKFFVNDSLKATALTEFHSADEYVLLEHYRSDLSSYTDWILVRKRTSNEPSISLGLVGFCEESDDGINYFVKGTLTDSTGTYEDSCSTNGMTLTEYYCENNIRKSINFPCFKLGKEYKCTNGACQLPSEEPTPEPEV